MSAARKFDLLVIGGGSGGVSVAHRAAGYGKRVAVVESGRMGGTCVNVGCIPKKLMFNAAHLAESRKLLQGYGFKGQDTSAAGLDFGHLKAKRDAYVQWLNTAYRDDLIDTKIDVFDGKATFVGPRRVKIGSSTEVVEADHVVIATGSTPFLPPVPGIEHAISSDGFFELSALPKRALLIGGGYIAVELAGIFAALGSTAAIAIRRPDGLPLAGFDEMLRAELKEALLASGVTIHAGLPLGSIRKDDATGALFMCSTASPTDAGAREIGPFDVIVCATGRVPNIDGLNLAAGGVAVTPSHHQGAPCIVADAFQNTSSPGTYALGDVIGKWELTPVAIAAGRLLADRLFKPAAIAGGAAGVPTSRLVYADIPSVVFSHPPIGTVGLTEAAARAEYGDAAVQVYTTKFSPMLYGLMEGPAHKPQTAMKLVCVGPQQRVAGVHIIGDSADEMLQGFAIAVKLGATKADFDSTVAIHPTISEELVTMPPWQPVLPAVPTASGSAP